MIEFQRFGDTYALTRVEVGEDELAMRKKKTIRDKVEDIMEENFGDNFVLQDPRMMTDYNSWELNRQYYYQGRIQRFIPEAFVERMMEERDGRKITTGTELYRLSVLVPRDDVEEGDMDVLEFEYDHYCPEIEEVYVDEIKHLIEDKELMEKWMSTAHLPQQIMHRMALGYDADTDYPDEWTEEAVDDMVWCAHELYNYNGIIDELVEEQGLDEEEFKEEYKKQTWEFLLDAYSKKKDSLLEVDLIRVEVASTEIYKHTLAINSLLKTCLRNIWCKCVIENIAKHKAGNVGLEQAA